MNSRFSCNLAFVHQERFQRLENLFLKAKSKEEGGHVKGGNVKGGNSFARSPVCLGFRMVQGFLRFLWVLASVKCSMYV